jgi:hypothetical protein
MKPFSGALYCHKRPLRRSELPRQNHPVVILSQTRRPFSTAQRATGGLSASAARMLFNL